MNAPCLRASTRSEQRSGRAIGVLLLAGWALYISVVVASNLSDLASSFGWEYWAFRSGNLDYIATATRIYVHSRALDQVLLAIVIVWEATAAVLLWRAAASCARSRSAAVAHARLGMTVLISVWFAFGISTEFFIAYDRGVDETAYWTLAIAGLISLLATERSVTTRTYLPRSTNAHQHT